MRGPRILLAVLALVTLLAVLALRDDTARHAARSLAVTQDAFAQVERALRGMRADWEYLKRLGPVLGLREEHDYVRTRLAELRARRVGLFDDPALDSLQRLPAIDDLVFDIDQLTAIARTVEGQIRGRARFIRECNPLLGRARDLAARLQPARDGTDPALATRAGQLATRFAELENNVRLALKVMQEDISQGERMADNVISALRTHVEQQQALLRQIDG